MCMFTLCTGFISGALYVQVPGFGCAVFGYWMSHAGTWKPSMHVVPHVYSTVAGNFQPAIQPYEPHLFLPIQFFRFL